jgi:hypothetical protein
MKRAIFLALVVLTLVPAAYACDECIDTQCVIVTPRNSYIIDGRSCGGDAQPWSTSTFKECRTIRGCQGCMGFTCDTQQIPNSTTPLRLVEVTITPAQPQTDAATPQQ